MLRRTVPATLMMLNMAQLLIKEHIVVLVALAEDTVVGGLVAYELEKFERERREVYIYDLAVEEARRRQGIASGLVVSMATILDGDSVWAVKFRDGLSRIPIGDLD